MSFDEFDGLEITDVMAAAFTEDSVTEPTPVQRVAMAPILAGRHVVVQSGTGTGKTLAYLLPILQRMKDAPNGRTVIFAPSSELAMQILRVAERYGGPSITTGALVGSSSITKSTRLIAGTPGRILELYARRKLKQVTTVVLDEPEPILAGRDTDFLLEVLSRPEPKVQLVVAGATMGPRCERLVQEVMNQDCVYARVDDSPLLTAITHHCILVREGTSKDSCLSRFLEENRCERAILFVNDDHLIRHVYRYLEGRQLRPVSLFSERYQEERKRAVAAFTESKARLLITNDAAGRGLNIPGIDWVLHYDLPHSAQAYQHRAGRTGRAGRKGRSVVLVSEDRQALLKRYAKELGIHFERVDCKGTRR